MQLLQSINALLEQAFGPLGPLLAVGALGVLLIVITLLTIPSRKADPLEKLREENSGTQQDKPLPENALRQKDTAGHKLDRFAGFLEPQDEKEFSSARLKMIQAGYRAKSAVRTFNALQFALGMGLLVLGVMVAIYKSAAGEISTTGLLLWVLGPALLGYYAPKYWIQRRRAEREQQIIEGFPDSLDMMLVCVEAGQSMDQSILRVSREIRAGYPALAEEFEIVSHEVKAGKDRVSVLKDMSKRCGVADINAFVTVLIQSATFGTSIADALRVYAGEMRDKRVMRAEEKANVLPTKLTLGTMLLTVPPLMIILIGPSVYGIYQTLNSHSF
ncbi:type II secretion system F family protein [Alkalilacustris brevis]|uniref:type II secretion system F family protein n=1 Tax=Alkalilacustris brevis TaxID=2026338 RepID=UPI000E0D5C53|nr:type II secretion system F family protein [Alkalilacustris brevis]